MQLLRWVLPCQGTTLLNLLAAGSLRPLTRSELQRAIALGALQQPHGLRSVLFCRDNNALVSLWVCVCEMK